MAELFELAGYAIFALGAGAYLIGKATYDSLFLFQISILQKKKSLIFILIFDFFKYQFCEIYAPSMHFSLFFLRLALYDKYWVLIPYLCFQMKRISIFFFLNSNK